MKNATIKSFNLALENLRTVLMATTTIYCLEFIIAPILIKSGLSLKPSDLGMGRAANSIFLVIGDTSAITRMTLFSNPIGINEDLLLTNKDIPFSLAVFGAPIVEEVFFRGIIQGLLLKEVPRIFMKEAEKYYNFDGNTLINSLPFKIFRCIASAAIFALAHTNYWNEDKAKSTTAMLTLFSLGLFCAAKSEIERLDQSIAIHMLNNAVEYGLIHIGIV